MINFLYYVLMNLSKTEIMVIGLSCVFFVCMVIFITLYLRALRRINDIKKNKKFNQWVARMIHDIRTPLNGMMGMTEIAIQNSHHSTMVVENLRKIQSSSNYLLSLVNEILDYSKIEENKVVLNKEACDLVETVEHCFDMIDGLVNEKKLVLVKRYHVTHKSVQVDAVRLKQILINVLGNAIKFTPNGNRIDFIVEEQKDAYHFIIRDTGIGMSEEVLNHIYDPFYQNKEGENGSGLGMTIVKRLVSLMGGFISVTSKVGKGSCFDISLPLEIKYEEKEKRNEKVLNLSCLKNMNILLVEDNVVNIEIVKCFLEQVGCKIQIAHNGAEGVKSFMDANPFTYDAILMDIRMPVMNGLEAAQKIRSLKRIDCRDIPMIAITGNQTDQEKQLALKAGFNYQISKPLNMEKLYEILIECREKDVVKIK